MRAWLRSRPGGRGLERPERDDDSVHWDTGAILGTGIGGMDTTADKVVPLTDAGKVRRLGSTAVEQVMASGISARISGQLALGNQVTTNSSALQHRHRGHRDGVSSASARGWRSACCAVARRRRATTSGRASTPCGC